MAALKLAVSSFYELLSYGRPLVPHKPFISTR